MRKKGGQIGKSDIEKKIFGNFKLDKNYKMHGNFISHSQMEINTNLRKLTITEQAWYK